MCLHETKETITLHLKKKKKEENIIYKCMP